jgi:hypothetical protein
MLRRSASAALHTMPEPEDQLIERMTDRVERRLAEECGRLRVEVASEVASVRVEMAHGFGTMRAEMEKGFGALRAEMIDRNANLLKWLLVFAVTQMAAIAALLRLFR